MHVACTCIHGFRAASHALHLLSRLCTLSYTPVLRCCQTPGHHNHFMVQAGGWHESATLLAGVEATVLNGGAVLCHPEWPVPLVTRVMTRLLILDVSRPVLRGQQVIHSLHAAMQEICAALVRCVATCTRHTVSEDIHSILQTSQLQHA